MSYCTNIRFEFFSSYGRFFLHIKKNTWQLSNITYCFSENVDVPFPKLLTYCPMTITLKSTEISVLHQRTNYSLYFPLSFKKTQSYTPYLKLFTDHKSFL